MFSRHGYCEIEIEGQAYIVAIYRTKRMHTINMLHTQRRKDTESTHITSIHSSIYKLIHTHTITNPNDFMDALLLKIQREGVHPLQPDRRGMIVDQPTATTDEDSYQAGVC